MRNPNMWFKVSGTLETHDLSSMWLSTGLGTLPLDSHLLSVPLQLATVDKLLNMSHSNFLHL